MSDDSRWVSRLHLDQCVLPFFALLVNGLPKLEMSLGVKNESSIFHDNLPIRLPVYKRKMMTDGGASRKVSGYPKSNESHPLGNSS